MQHTNKPSQKTNPFEQTDYQAETVCKDYLRYRRGIRSRRTSLAYTSRPLGCRPAHDILESTRFEERFEEHELEEHEFEEFESVESIEHEQNIEQIIEHEQRIEHEQNIEQNIYQTPNHKQRDISECYEAKPCGSTYRLCSEEEEELYGLFTEIDAIICDALPRSLTVKPVQLVQEEFERITGVYLTESEIMDAYNRYVVDEVANWQRCM